MANKQINQLTAAPQALADTDVAAIEQDVASVWTTGKITLLALYNWIVGKLNTAGRIIPSGGTTWQALVKTSSTDYAVSWQDVQAPLPTTTLPGYVLTQQSTVAGDIDWQAPGEGLPAYTAPDDNGKVVTLVAGIPSWQTPSGGTTYRQTLSATRRT